MLKEPSDFPFTVTIEDNRAFPGPAFLFCHCGELSEQLVGKLRFSSRRFVGLGLFFSRHGKAGPLFFYGG